MKLSSLLSEVGFKSDIDLEVSSITANSQEVRLGSIFIAIKGLAHDGHDSIDQAFKSGARFVVGEKPIPKGIDPSLYLKVPDTKKVLGLIASAFYGHPSRKMQVFGVTGTSGKTTTSFLMESVLKAKGHKVGLIGTVLYRIGDQIQTSTHTTPGAVELQKMFHEMSREGCDSVVIEVSSHALKQDRTWGVCFDGAIFSNLTPEHLDYHPDMDDYFNSKALLFKEYADYAATHGKKKFFASINQDSPYGEKLIKQLEVQKKSSVVIAPFTAQTFISSGIKSHLQGTFNNENCASVVALFKAVGFSDSVITKGIESLQGVPGRLEQVRNNKGITVLVDYAHKPDALEKVLKALRPGTVGKLICVFGCGGDRDTTKRQVMGEIAERLSDHVIVTSDNPRTEDPVTIIEQILGGMKKKALTVEPDRKLAIEQAIAMASSGDCVLIAGKGHEDYQIIGTTKLPFDDRLVAAEVLKNK
ncbi:MAG: UDP-N-acetylmuramoyl-L-alanyl-D-glutamate--2,6-diaminopimelate ligase [Xanthomonadaceae bacterium]|nr:UDP-N-acetylmuramoyl-L-alanyl-D-glutamate--2,6-diaminopimelate ligase [Xanthomonadaceae bacterium]